jgi:hypothetical protein
VGSQFQCSLGSCETEDDDDLGYSPFEYPDIAGNGIPEGRGGGAHSWCDAIGPAEGYAGASNYDLDTNKIGVSVYNILANADLQEDYGHVLAESDGRSSIRSDLSFRRTAWYWFDATVYYQASGEHGSAGAQVTVFVPGFSQTWDTIGTYAGSGVITSVGHASLQAAGEARAWTEVDYPSASGHAAAEANLCIVECLADWNRDHIVDSRDAVAFLNDWNALTPDADLNGDGVVNTQDFTIFLNAHAAGNCTCPNG